MGDLPIAERDEDDPETLLLFQIASDGAMGWSWHGEETLYVTISPQSLRRSRFDQIRVWIAV